MPFPFVVFWGAVGLAIGVAAGGSTGLLTAPVPQEIYEQRNKEK